jgi:anthranilate phosphoribosyltransferase
LDATDLGLQRATLDDLMGGSAGENAVILRGILSGEIGGAKRDVVLLNSAAALSTECGDWKAGLDEAAQSIDSGAALKVLDQFVEKTRSYMN